jgi:uncharacterized protein (DUF2236 family)
MHDGLYQRDDWMWRVNREAVLLLTGPRALLMQLAHPLVAAGVTQHSDFRSDPLGRLRRTLSAMLGIIFGARAHGEQCAERINRVHERIAGELSQATGPFPSGTRYSAFDPELLLWVQATLLDSAVVGYEAFVAPLSPQQLEDFYQGSKRMAPLLRIPSEVLPDTWGDFRERVDRWIEGRELAVGRDALELAADVLRPRLPFLPRAALSPSALLTAGLLPATLRERYGLPWTSRRAALFRTLCGTIRVGRPLLPRGLRWFPEARRSEHSFQEAGEPR